MVTRMRSSATAAANTTPSSAPVSPSPCTVWQSSPLSANIGGTAGPRFSSSLYFIRRAHRHRNEPLTSSLGSVRDASLNILPRQMRIRLKDIVYRIPTGQEVKDQRHPDSRPLDARL